MEFNVIVYGIPAAEKTKQGVDLNVPFYSFLGYKVSILQTLNKAIAYLWILTDASCG